MYNYTCLKTLLSETRGIGRLLRFSNSRFLKLSTDSVKFSHSVHKMGVGSSVEKGPLADIYNEQGEDAFVKAVWDSFIDQEDYNALKGIDFDFDCLAFEGGGVKGAAYAGAVKVLEDLGVLPKIKRFAGTSAGAYMAMQLAIGMPVDTIFKTNGIPNMQDAFYDSRSWSLPYNILYYFGWHSGSKLLHKIEDDLEKYLGDRNATFLDLYKKRNVELCVVVTDLNGRNVEYVHPKTMPAIRIADAVKTSMSLPFLFAPTTVAEQDMQRYFVDGGLLENYPVRVYDGWYLSMKKEDDFFQRMEEESRKKFEGFNPKMLGMVVFSHGENQSNSDAFIKRYGSDILDQRPDSKLSLEREYTRNLTLGKDKKHQLEESARKVVKFIASEASETADEYGTFSHDSFRDIIRKLQKDSDLSLHLEHVLGPEGFSNLEQSFNDMDINGDNRLSIVECLTYLQKKGVYLRYNLKARHPRKIQNMPAFVTSIIEVMQSYISELEEKPQDQGRTIGIYTDYITTTDFDMSLDDKAYMLRLGYKATINFLKEKYLSDC